MPLAAPLLLLPGLLCDAHVWSAQAAAFADAGVIAVDGYAGARSLADMARHALEQAPPRFSLAGHSMGARVALEVWRTAPERVARIALLDSGTHLPRPNEAAGRHALLQLGRDEGIDALIDAWLPPMVAPALRDDAALMEPMRAMCRKAGVAGYENGITALLGRPEVDSLLPTITCPALVGVGSEDAWAPVAQHEAIAARIAGAELVVFAGAGHMAPLEAPDQVNAALAAWLRRD